MVDFDTTMVQVLDYAQRTPRFRSEAARAAIAYGFRAGLGEIYAVVRPDNHASMAVCRRLGMRPLGRTRRWYDAELESFVI